ncbi:mannose-6-phosphate isomerase, class I [Marinitenerispora sediminis]|uniref:mannose-6-phosphate isomerase n=1 Tax=Marinitenerispora sediminis TaxID=1931232 RepID=A0A368T002_9ACTN|nr:mannose-6-phosphate isomerase, class I [Marinitenerispora sediminis]RCV49558.1 mannose-6-phosphate isomerase, class I [Marinitenerispora sediminis]RCV50458.1 mannose-6-phosphate isomerase, class I [Marinitenerispora sediminis]RCV52145.1 mannose-6-phosphate isomerase, class I [Marinitenerispora sediminis]
MRRLINQIRPYAWGSPTAIPRLLGRSPDGRPQAELWLGAHPGAPSSLATEDGPVCVADAIAGDPKETLGERTVRHFGERLPFLLKVLAAEEPLSLQAHPDTRRAALGHAAEEAAGIPVDAPHRNYRDPFHKPELVLALEPFEALCGFREPAAALADLAGLTAPLAGILRADLSAAEPGAALRAAMTRLLTLAPDERAGLVGGLVAELAARVSPTGPARRHAATVAELAERYPGDPGAVAALLLNRITLRPGEALFLPAGNVHAYLRGTAVEVMASSDNVLRAGLTGKHVDVAELLTVVDFSVLPIPFASPERVEGRWEYQPGVADFALSVIRPHEEVARLPGGLPAIVLVLDGTAELRTEAGERLPLARGESAFVPAADGPVTVEGAAHLVAATVGDSV